FLTLQRGNAVGDALRHKSSSRCKVRIGRTWLPARLLFIHLWNN
ncbi:hypothetical protein CCL07_00240, partial [Pseudomonas congelans]